jgi:hypothetical protein
MSDTDEIRAALSEALRLPGEIQARPGAAGTIRARARSRRRTAVVTFAVAVPACLGLVAVLTGIGPNVHSVSPPASKVSPAPSPSVSSIVIGISPGPRTLATPIEIRPVLREYLPLTCPANAHTVPAVDSSGCYRLGPAAIVMHRVRDMDAGIGQGGNDGIELDLTMTAHDAAAFSVLTRALLNKQIALVVDGKVWMAPTIAGRITEGRIQISVRAASAQAFVTELTG